MDTYQFLIYDDNPAACSQLKKMLYATVMEQIHISTAVSRKEAEALLTEETVVLFQDIELDTKENGISFAEKVRQNYPHIRIIFVTAHVKYCEDIFAIEPSGFLVKPYTIDKIERLLASLRRKFKEDTSDYLLMHHSRNSITRVVLNRISCIESSNRRLVFFNEANEPQHEFRGRFGMIEQNLPSYFIRCHYSFYVNLHYVSEVQRYSFTLKNGKTVPISQRNFKKAKEEFIRFLGDTL